MNHLNRYLRIILSLTLLVFMTACELDEDVDPVDGDTRDKFTGSWLFSESPAARSISYNVTISKDPSNSSQVILKNFGNFGTAYSAYGIVTSSRIVVPSQIIYPGMTISGDGTMPSNSRMQWTYSIEGGGELENYVATATK